MVSFTKTEIAVRERQAKARDIVEQDGLRETYEKLADRFHGIRRRTAEDFYEVGELVIAGAKEAVDKHVVHETGKALSLWNAALGLQPRMLYKCAEVVNTYNRGEFLELVKLKGLTIAHLDVLILATPSDRRRLAEQASTEGWSAEQLRSEIRPQNPPKPRGPGRAPAVPRNVKQGLARAQKASAAFLKLLKQALFCDEFRLGDEIRMMPSTELDGEMRDQLAQTIRSFEELARAAPNIVDHLSKAVPHVEEACAARQVGGQPDGEHDGDDGETADVLADADSP